MVSSNINNLESRLMAAAEMRTGKEFGGRSWAYSGKKRQKMDFGTAQVA